MGNRRRALWCRVRIRLSTLSKNIHDKVMCQFWHYICVACMKKGSLERCGGILGASYVSLLLEKVICTSAAEVSFSKDIVLPRCNRF
jgi:hypothetical protein